MTVSRKKFWRQIYLLSITAERSKSKQIAQPHETEAQSLGLNTRNLSKTMNGGRGLKFYEI